MLFVSSKREQSGIYLEFYLLSIPLRKAKKKTVKKLHEQFGHASSKRIIDLVRDEGTEDAELFECHQIM